MSDREDNMKTIEMHTTVIKDEEDGFQVAPTLNKKWHGSPSDRKDMTALGRVQELRRNFHFISIMGFGSTLICSWEVIACTLLTPLIDGGTAGLIWGFIACFIGFGFVYASVAEMASMAPTSGGQYHWVSEFAPRSCQKYLSYITGWLCFTGWQGAICGIAFFVGTLIQGLMVLNDPTYVPERWHGTLLVIASAAFSILFNTFLAKKLPLVEGLVLVIHVLGLFAVIIPLWVLAPRNNAQAVFTEFSNGGGWDTTGTAVMVGLISPILSMLGFDCVVHMSEEVKDAGRTIPKAIMSSVLVNAALGFIMVITLCFTLGDVEAISTSPTGYPFIQIFYNSTQSYAGTNVMVTILIVTLMSSCISEIATASRQIWSFARDRGTPFASTIAKVTPGWNIPLNAVMISLFVTICLSLINIGSTVALNAILSLTTASLLTSYMVCIGCVLLRRIRGQELPPRRWSLGKGGMFINIGALCFLAPVYVFSFFPLIKEVDATTMNWSCVIYGGVIIFANIYYVIFGRHQYTPPLSRVDRGRVQFQM